MRTLIVLTGLAGTFFVGLPAEAAEPVFKEQTLGAWRKKLQDPGVQVRQTAAGAFAEMDADLAKQGVDELTSALRDEDSQVRFFAARALGRIGPEARGALSELLKLVAPEANVYVASAAGVAIAGIDPESPDLPRVVRVLLQNDQTLGKALTKSPSLAGEFLRNYPDLAVRHAVPLLENEDRVLRQRAARVLAAAGPPARDRAEKALLKAVHDEDAAVRAAAIDALYRVAPTEIRAALPVLIKLVAARGFQAFSAAEIFRPYDADVCPQLIRELAGRSPAEQAELVSTLALLHPTSLRHVIAAFNDPAATIRIGAAAVTATIGKKAAVSIPGLVRLTQDPDAAVRLQAIEALVRVDDARQHLTQWLPAVEALVRVTSPPEQRSAVAVLKLLGPDAKEAAPTLLAAMAQSAETLRLDMALALVRIDHRQGPQALPVLREALDHPDRPWESEVVRTVGELGPLAKETLPALHRIFEEHKDDFDERLIVAMALTRIDRAEIASCLPIVVEMMQQEPRRSLRVTEAILTLTEWGAAAQPAAPVLRQMVAERRSMMRKEAAVSIGGKIPTRNVIAAAAGLVLIGDDEHEAGLKLIRHIVATPEESDGRWQLLYLLGRLGPAAKPLANEVRPLLRDPDFAVRTHEVLANIGH